MAYGKKNQISVNPLEYNLGLIGLAGIGKTSTIKEYCEILAPEDGGYLFVECGKENGADTIQGINYINCPDWNSDYDELNNSLGFSLLIEDIIENKTTEYPNLKVVVIDTYDQLKEIANVESVRRYNKEQQKKDKPRVESVKAAWGGFMAGEDYADDLMLDALWSLKKVGVHFIVIGHIKQKDIVDPITEVTYTQLTTDMSTRSFNKIKNKLDVLGAAYIDREIIDKVKKEKLVNKKKVEVEVGKIGSETRKITFRDDNYAIDSKCRFANIEPVIPLSGQALVDTMKKAIETEISNKGGTVAANTKVQKNLDKKKEEAAKKYSAKAKAHKIDPERNEELAEIIKDGFMGADDDTKQAIKDILAKYDVPNLKDIPNTPTEALEKIADLFA